MKKLFVAATVFFLFTTMCLSLSYAGPETDHSNSLINPLIKYHKFKMLRPFRPELKALIDRLENEGGVTEIAVYFRSLNDGLWIGVNEKILFAPASLLKVPLMMIYLKKAEKDPSLLKNELTVEDIGKYQQFVPSRIMLGKGKKYPVEKLLEIMVQDSNNDAMKVLSIHADPKLGMKMYRQFGYTSTFQEQGDFLSLKTYVGTFRVLYNAAYLNEAMSEKALHILAHVHFGLGIAKGLPPGITIANKFGEYRDPRRNLEQLHDVGIVYYPEAPYILGVMTRGDDYKKMANAISEISSFIYHQVDSQYKASSEPDYDLDFNDEN